LPSQRKGKARSSGRTSPWLTVWISPGKASMELLKRHSVRALVWIIPVLALGTGAQRWLLSIGQRIPITLGQLALWTLAGLIIAIAMFVVGSLLFYRVGRLNGGTGSPTRIRLSVLVNMILAFVASPLTQIAPVLLGRLHPALTYLGTPLILWMWYVQLRVSANAHSFSPWNAAVTKIMGGAVVGVPLCCAINWAFSNLPWDQILRGLGFN